MKQIRVGITGGISSGKTTVSKLFEDLGIPVFNSDKAAREAESDETMVVKIKEILGDDIYVDGVIDRPRMRDMVFKNPEILSKMNALVAPFVKETFRNFCVDNVQSPIIMIESAILFELDATEGLDKIIVVTADEELRIQRAMKRDGVSREQVLDKIKAQFSDKEKIERADFLIYNNGTDLIDSIKPLKLQIGPIITLLTYEQMFNYINNVIKK
jgi:dephospho-CoA kinase